jgi:hypothetical protein
MLNKNSVSATADHEMVDVVDTRGATFELVHPLFPVIERICARARRHVVMVLTEIGTFISALLGVRVARHGVELRKLCRPASPLTPDHLVTLFSFERR